MSGHPRRTRITDFTDTVHGHEPRGFRKKMGIPKRLVIPFLILVIIFEVGIIGYELIEGWGFLDALYMTTISLATVGYGEVHPLSPIGKVFTIGLLLSGVGILLYVVGSGIAFLVEGELGGMLRRRKMEKQIEKLSNHYIICAEGETSEYVIEEFAKTKRDFVIVTNIPDLIAKLSARGDIFLIPGDPTEDRVLVKAGIMRAKGLLSVLQSVKDNLFVVLTARQLNSKLRIVARAIEEGSDVKLKKAGADEIVCTDAIGGMRMASAMIRPTVVSFLDQMLYQKETILRLEETVIPSKSSLTAKTLNEGKIPERTGLMVIAVKDSRNNAYIYNPPANYTIKPNDVLITIGTPEQVKKLQALVGL